MGKKSVPEHTEDTHKATARASHARNVDGVHVGEGIMEYKKEQRILVVKTPSRAVAY